MNTPQSSYDTISKLVEIYRDVATRGGAMEFDETSTRITLLNPFWEALGWDVADPREVIHEKRIATRQGTKRADYCFNVRGKPSFVLEAKQPNVSLRNADVVFQAKRYGYNLPVNFAILSDFEEFRLFDSGLEPKYDNPARGLIKKFDLTFEQYLDHWDDIYATFSRDAIYDGSLDLLLPKSRKKRNKEALDNKFFEHLTKWREEFARVIALDNGDLSVYDINEAVQRILDRVIFIRVIEDREIESVEHLQSAVDRWKREKEKPLYRYIVDVFRKMDPQYNGQLFAEHFSEDMMVRDKVLGDFIKSLYYPECGYQFNVIGVEMLGTIYERFLGSTITLTPAHRAKVEEKPEVRKAGGVYYTPSYIVEYIVENTVGELLAKCKTPRDVAKLKVLDPACGSGSFLLGAFERLIKWYEEYYNANPNKIKKPPATPDCWLDREHPDGERWRLTAKRKGQILRENIFGVDIDSQAVEVTIMSLYLKVLENVNAQFLIKTALLPPMESNIKCGNSLIGSDYWEFLRDGRQDVLFERNDAEERRVNTFDWDVEFADIIRYTPGTRELAEGFGFDAVIGNPPWIDIKGLFEIFVDYYFAKYSTTSNRINVYAVFIEKGLELLKDNGYSGNIIPNSILYQTSYEKLRLLILEDFTITNIARMPDKVFGNVKAESVIITSMKKKPRVSGKTEVIIFDKDLMLMSFDRGIADEIKQVNQSIWGDQKFSAFNIFVSEKEQRIIKKIEEEKSKLEELCDFTLGITPYDKYKGHSQNEIKNKAFHANAKLSDDYGKLLAGGDVSRYLMEWNGDMWLKYGPWLGAPREERFFNDKRILIRQIVSGTPSRILATLVEGNYYNTQSIFNILPKQTANEDIKYILAIMNSLLLNFYHTNRYLDKSKKLFQKILIQNAKLFPIREIDFSDSSDVSLHNEMVRLVDEMLDLHKRLAAAKSDSDKTRLERSIAVTDKKIDTLVYELYKLTDEEIKVVEGN